MDRGNRPLTKSRIAARRGRRGCGWLLAFAALLVPAQASAVDSALIRSLLVPGLGQAHKGHYTRAAVFAGTAVLSGFGAIVSHVYYNEAVDKYRVQKRLYASYAEVLGEGGEDNVVSFEDIRSTYANMEAAYDACEDRLLWRNAFLAVFVATHAINVVDILLSEPDKDGTNQPLTLEVGPGTFRVTKAFRF